MLFKVYIFDLRIKLPLNNNAGTNITYYPPTKRLVKVWGQKTHFPFNKAKNIITNVF
jgi:hypothetical protein